MSGGKVDYSLLDKIRERLVSEPNAESNHSLVAEIVSLDESRESDFLDSLKSKNTPMQIARDFVTAILLEGGVTFDAIGQQAVNPDELGYISTDPEGYLFSLKEFVEEVRNFRYLKTVDTDLKLCAETYGDTSLQGNMLDYMYHLKTDQDARTTWLGNFFDSGEAENKWYVSSVLDLFLPEKRVSYEGLEKVVGAKLEQFQQKARELGYEALLGDDFDNILNPEVDLREIGELHSLCDARQEAIEVCEVADGDGVQAALEKYHLTSLKDSSEYPDERTRLRGDWYKMQAQREKQKSETPPEILAEVEALLKPAREQVFREQATFAVGPAGKLSAVPATTTEPEKTDALPPKDNEPDLPSH